MNEQQLAEFAYHPPMIPWLDIRYQDKDVIIINKPSGLLSNPGRAAHTHDCALTRLQKHFGQVYLVHRLDCATSGVMVFAKRRQGESHLKTQFQDRKTQKVYVAEVAGLLTKSFGTIDLPLAANKQRVPTQMVCHATGKAAHTYYEVLERREQTTLVMLKPTTGRTHQLRVHMAELGHPICGDDFYGDAEVIAMRPRLCLHAQSLSFSHPYSQQKLQFTCPHPF